MPFTRRSFGLALGGGALALPSVLRAATPDLRGVTLRIGDQVG
jgi:hypothetical protein